MSYALQFVRNEDKSSRQSFYLLPSLYLILSVDSLNDVILMVWFLFFRKELRLWELLLKERNGSTFFYDNCLLLHKDIQPFKDAAPSLGFGGYYKGKLVFCSMAQRIQHYSYNRSLLVIAQNVSICCSHTPFGGLPGLKIHSSPLT